MDDKLFRNAMGSFATGVTVILSELDGEVYGMTANAFMSVSLDPKLVVISIGERAQMLERLKKSQTFSVNILSEEQQDYSSLFAGQRKNEEKVAFDYLNDIPVLPGANTQVTCDVAAEHAAGDHTLFIGNVKDIQLNEAEPLIFYKGKYHRLEGAKV